MNEDLMLTNTYNCDLDNRILGRLSSNNRRLNNNIEEVDGFEIENEKDLDFKRKLRRTTITIDSINRIRKPQISKRLVGKLPNNPFKTQIGSKLIKVWCPYEELLDINGDSTKKLKYVQYQNVDIGRTQLIFSNLKKDISEDGVNGYNYYKIGVQRKYIEFDNNDIVNKIYLIKEIGYKLPLEVLPGYEYTENKKYKSDYFVIELNEKINTTQIIKGEFGGEGVILNEVTSFINGYENSSHYKIDLGREYTNVYMVKLRSIVLPNTAYTINSREETSNIGNFNVRTKVNNKLKWVNKLDKTNVYNLSLYSDKIFSRSINFDNLIKNSNKIQEQSTNQKNYSDEFIEKLTADKDMSKCSEERKLRSINMREVYSDITNLDNKNSDYYSEKCLHTDDNKNELTETFDNTLTGNNGKYWLPNMYHNLSKTLIYFIFESITKPYYTNDQYINSVFLNINKDNIDTLTLDQKKIYNRNIKKLLRNNPWHYYYFNSLVNKGTNNLQNSDRRTINNINSNNNLLDFEYTNNLSKNFKYLVDLDIPKYMGYHIFESVLEDGQQESKLNEELIENYEESRKYIYPSNYHLTDKLLAPTLVPNLDTNVLNLKNQIRYPIYEASLTDGKYTTKSFIKELQNKLSGTFKKNYDGEEKIFENQNFSLDKFDFQPIFNVNVNKNLNFIDIRQYTPITKYIDTQAYNPNLIYYNEGIPLIAMRLFGHSLNTGDKILVTGANDTDNIEEESINGEHIINVAPSFKINMRLIYPLPELAYLDQNKYFNETIGKDIELEDKTLEFKIKRDLRKFLLKPDDLISNIPTSNLWYGGNWEKEHPLHESQGAMKNFDNKPIIWEGYSYDYSENGNSMIGNAIHSKRELYPIKYISNDSYKTNLTFSWNNPYMDSQESNMKLIKGNKVQAKRDNDYVSGIVDKVNDNNSYDIKYDDTLIINTLNRDEIRLDMELFGNTKFESSENTIINTNKPNLEENYPRSWANVNCYNRVTKPYELERYYGKFKTNIPYQFGIYYSGSNSYQIKNFVGTVGGFKELEPRSQKHLNEGSLIMSIKNALLSAPNNRQFTTVKSEESDTLRTNYNYFGSKMINSVNNGIMYPEDNNSFKKNNSISAKGIECSMLVNETFVKLSDIKNITNTTTIGRVIQINNNNRLNDMGNFEIYFDLITEIELGNFNIGDVIIGLDSNCIGMIVPESWEYCSLIEDEVINKGFGTYILEKYRNLGPINKMISKANNTYIYKDKLDINLKNWKKVYDPNLQNSDDLNKFLKKYDNWSIQESPYSSQFIYYSIEPIFPSKSRISGIKTTDLVISKPVEFKFIFDENTSPIDRLNIPIEQSFNFSQNNLKKFNEININKSYLLGLNNGTLQDYLVIETFEKMNFKKNDKIYIKNHKTISRNINNNKVYNLTIESVEPFRNYIQFLQNNFYNIIKYDLNEITMYNGETREINIPSDETNIIEIEKIKRNRYSHYENNIFPVPFSNINLIWDYNVNKIQYCLGKDKDLSTSYSIDNDLHDKFKTITTETMICISKPIESYHLPLNKGDIVRQYYGFTDPKIVACGTIKNFVSSGNEKKIINIEIEDVAGTFIGNTEVSNIELYLDIKRPNKKFVILKFFIGDLSSNNFAKIKVNDKIIQGTSSGTYVGKPTEFSRDDYLIFETNISSNFIKGINSPPIYIERLNPINTYPDQSKILYQEIFPKITHIEVIIDPYLDNKNYDIIKVINPNINELDTDAFEQNTIVTKDENNDPWIDKKNLSSDFEKVYSKSIYYSGKNPNNNLNNLNLVKRGPFELFNNDNLTHFGIKERLINWFFENPFNWNNNNLEKVLEFKNKYEPSIENKNIIVKLIVSPLDSYGMNFLKNGFPSFFKRAGNLSELAYKGAKVIPFNDRPREGGYTDVSGRNTTVNRNVNTILPFLNGMGVYINNPFLEKYTTLESIEKFNNGETDTQYTVKLIDPFWDYDRNEYIGELYSLNTFSNNRSNANNQYIVGWKSTHQDDNGKWLGNYENVERLGKTDTAEPQSHHYLFNDPLEAIYKRPVSGLIGYVLDTTIENIEDYINNYGIKSYALDVSTITRQETTTVITEEETTISNSVKTENLIGTPSLDCSIHTNPPKGDISQRSYEFYTNGKYTDFKTTLNNRNKYDLNNDGNQDILGVTDTHKSIFSLNPYYDSELENYNYDINLEQYADGYLIKTLKKFRDNGDIINQNQDDTIPYKLTDWINPEKPYKFAFTRQRWWVEKQLCIFYDIDQNELEIPKYPDDNSHDNISLFTWKNIKPIYNDKAKIYIKQSLLYSNDTRYQHHKGEYISNSYLNDNNNPNYRGVMKVEIITEFDGSYGLDSDYKSIKGITKNTIGGDGAEFIISKNFYNKFPNISISKPGTGYDVGDIIDLIVQPYSNGILKNKAFYACTISITDPQSPYNSKDPIKFYTGDSILIKEMSTVNNIYPAVKGIIPFNQSIIQEDNKLIIKMLTSTTIDINLRGVFQWTKINSLHGSTASNSSLNIGATLEVNVVNEFNNIDSDPTNNFYPIQNLQLLVKEVIVSNSIIGPSRLICNTSEWNKRGMCEGYINTFNDNTIRNNDIKEIIITSGGGKYSPFLLKTIKKQSIKFISYLFNDEDVIPGSNFRKIKLSNNNPINIIQKTNSNKIIAHGQVLVGNALTEPNNLLTDNIENFAYDGIDYNIDRNELLIELDKIILTLDKSYQGEISGSILVKNSDGITIGNIIDNNLLTNEIIVKIDNSFTSDIKIQDKIKITFDDNEVEYTILNIQNQFTLNISVINGLFIDMPNSRIYFEYYENNGEKHTSINNPIYISKFSIINDNNLYTNTIDPNFSKNFRFVFSPNPQVQKISGIFYPKLPNSSSVNGNWLNRSQWWDGSLPDPQEWGVLNDFIIEFEDTNIKDYEKNDIIMQKDTLSNIIASGSVKINYTLTNIIEINTIFGEFIKNDNYKIYINRIEYSDYKIKSLGKRNNPKGLYNPSIQYKEEVRKIIPDFEYLHPDIQFNELCIDSTIPTSWTLNDNSLNPKNNIILGAHNGDFKASVNLVDFAPTYSIYLLVNKDSILFKEDDWIESSNSLNYNNMSYLTRGTNIFFNIDKLKQLNTVNNDECDQYDTDIEMIGSDSNTLGSYNWRNRQAVATIFQGVLEKNDVSLVDDYEGIPNGEPNEYYTIPFVPPQNIQINSSNTIGRGGIIYKEEPIINSNYKSGGLEPKVIKTYKKIYIHPKPNKIEDYASLKYNQARDLITVNDYNNIYYDLNVSGNEEFRVDPSDNILKSRAEFVHQYKHLGTDNWNNAEYQDIPFRIDTNDQKLKTYDEFISLYGNEDLWCDALHTEVTKNINTTVSKSLFNNYQKINRIILGKKYIKPIFLVSGHLDYFYSFYLQNKSILNLSKAYENISKDSINNIQNIMETKEFNISEDTKYNNFNDLNKETNSNPKLKSRSNVVNFENLDFLPLNSSTNILVHNHTKQVSKYNDFSNIIVGDSTSVANCTSLQTNTSFNNFEKNFMKENIGINDGAYSVLCSLWSGSINNSILFNKYKAGRAVLTDIEFDDQVEKGSYNKGNVRVKTKKIPIIGNNSKTYRNNFDIDAQNEFAGYIKYDNTGLFNRRCTNKLKIEYAYSNSMITCLDLMFEENDLLFISSNIHSNDNNGNYKTTNIKCCLNNSEIGIVKNKPVLSGDCKDYIEVELKNSLINDHNPDNDSINNGRELVIARYKYGEIYQKGIHTKNLFEDYSNINNNNRFIWNSENHYIHYTDGGYKSYYDPIQYPYLVKIKRYIDSQNESSIDYSLDKYLAVGDTICFDWGTQRYIDYINTDERLPPFDIVPAEYIDTNNNTVIDSYKKEMKGDLRFMYTQQFNRILKKSIVNENVQTEYIMIMLEKRPYIHYPENTPFIIFKQTHRDSIHNDNNKKNNINFNSISTQPFTYNNELYTKVFYQGDKPITTTFNCHNWKFNEKYLSFNENNKKYKYEYKHRLYSNMQDTNENSNVFSYKKYENDDVHNDLKGGCKMFNNNLRKNIHIDSMKGIDIPLIPVPNSSNISYYNDLLKQTTDNFVIETISTGPIKDSNLETEPIVIEDFNNLVENKYILPILGQNYNFADLFERYNTNNSNESSKILDQILENYTTRKNNVFWEDYIDTYIIKNNKFENINFRNQMLYTYEDVFNSEYFYVFLESILYDEIYQSSSTSFNNLSEKLYSLLDKADKKQYDYTPVLYNYVIVKGMYFGYGGNISEKNIDETNIINNSDGWNVISVVNQNTNTQPNRIIIDINKSLLNINTDETNIHKDKIFSKFNNSLQKLPTGVFDYDILLDNLQSDVFNNTREIGNGGTIFMQKLSAPLNLIGNNYIYLCIPEFQGQMETSSTKIISNAFAKILLPGESNQTLYNTFTSGTKIFYQKTLSTLDSIEVCFLTDDKFLFDFNGLEHSFSIEIYEIIDYV